jgi:Delta7-sterol 5-desaturase
MPIHVIIYAVVLAVINYPFVLAVDWYARSRPVRVVYRVREPEGQRAREIRNSWITTPVHAVLFFTFIAYGALLTGSESVGLAARTFALAFFWTEVWHYASHVAMHTKALHFIHREHHLSRLTGPWTSVSFSLLEKFIFSFGILAGLSLASRWHTLSAFGIFAYYAVYFYANTLGHANFEFRKAGYCHRLVGQILNSPSYHALHHARYTRNYGLLTPWLDRIFGTQWGDVAAVQTRAATGSPLTRLGEKCAHQSMSQAACGESVETSRLARARLFPRGRGTLGTCQQRHELVTKTCRSDRLEHEGQPGLVQQDQVLGSGFASDDHRR